MGSSGLIYAAIVAGWAAILVPRWVRQNEEIDQAREADKASGVRVLDPSTEIVRSARTQARHEPLPVIDTEPPAAPDEPVGGYDDGRAARRRRRVLFVLVVALATVTVIAVIGTLPLWSVAIPAALLVGFIHLAHRAALVKANEPPARRRLAESPGARNSTAARTANVSKPEPAEPVDPHTWQPVPVPLPTYLLKDKAPESATRTIDLNYSGAWTSGRLEPARSATLRPVPMPPPADEIVVNDTAEHRTAVGD
jgi:hypothetical protein